MLRNKLLAFLVFVIIVATVFFVGGVSVRNSLIDLQTQCESQWAQIESQLQRRDDLIPKLVEVTREYATHEEDVFDSVNESREKLMQTEAPQEAAEAEAKLSGSIGRLFAIAEAYPELKANENYLRLQDELEGAENRIAASRGRYNELVAQFNAAIKKFPGSLFAQKLGLQPIEFFKRDAPDKAADPDSDAKDLAEEATSDEEPNAQDQM